MVMHAESLFLLYNMEKLKLCSVFGEDWSISGVTILSTDAGWTPDTGQVKDFIFCLILVFIRAIGAGQLGAPSPPGWPL